MESQEKEKMMCRKGCGRGTKTKPAQSQEERREREVKIRKNTVVYRKQTHVGWLNGFPCSRSLGWPSTTPCCPAMLSHAAKTWISRSKLNMKNHWEGVVWPSHRCLSRGGEERGVTNFAKAASWWTIQTTTIYLKYQSELSPGPLWRLGWAVAEHEPPVSPKVQVTVLQADLQPRKPTKLTSEIWVFSPFWCPRKIYTEVQYMYTYIHIYKIYTLEP